MLAASSRLRIAAALVATALATLFAAAGSAQSIDLSLNVSYSDPANSASGGTWELVAKSSPSPTTFGISGISVYLRNINNDAVIEAPRGIVNGANVAGFQILGNIFHPPDPPNPSYREIIVAQLPLRPLPSGSEENLFYGVGTLANGSPGNVGPAFTSLTNPQDIPWADPTPTPFNGGVWATAARMLSGSFSAGVSPSFFTGSLGNVFTSVPANNTSLGNEILATAVTTIVRTNLTSNSADYNQNGIVDAADYVLWRKTPAAYGGTPAGYDLWRSHFGNPMGAGSGGGLSTGTIPEPTSCLLLTIGALLATAPRRGRFQDPVNN